jgi:hypothetical protein
MDPGIRSPLVDFFRRGEVARDVRLLAAQGALAPRAHEQLALLVLLADDPDLEIARAAERTIGLLPRDPLSAFLARSDVTPELRAFFSARGVEPAAEAGPVSDDALTDPLLDATVEEAAAPGGEQTPLALLPILDRMKLAMKGTREQRAALVRDPNKMVSVAVLSSPKLTETEVEGFAKMANVSEEVLRIIATNRAWTKNYTIVSALVRNPKTPPALSLNMVRRLNERDIKMLAIDRNVPEALRLAARKALTKGHRA